MQKKKNKRKGKEYLIKNNQCKIKQKQTKKHRKTQKDQNPENFNYFNNFYLNNEIHFLFIVRSKKFYIKLFPIK